MDTNMWGTDKSLINEDEFCPECERMNGNRSNSIHYNGCIYANVAPLKVVSNV